MHSYHIFYFPFKWELKGRENRLFSEQVDLSALELNPYTRWLRNPGSSSPEEQDELYNEKNYYYQFTHDMLYDSGQPDSLIYHYEHRDTASGEMRYLIKVRGRDEPYVLELKAINLNLYSTGVGMLSFYLENNDYPHPEDVLKINQYGRRVFPPFIADLQFRGEIAEYIEIQGIVDSKQYKEDFEGYTYEKPWTPASFICNLILDLSGQLETKPVIDDRMFVNCWYSNRERAGEVAQWNGETESGLFTNDFWYRYLFVDGSWATCQNAKMMSDLLKSQTYMRWQQFSTMYGFSRYSLVLLFELNGDNWYLPIHMRTIYSRMVEIVLIAKASILRYSAEVTRVSKMAKDDSHSRQLALQVSSLYQNYIHFINRFYFKQLTTQDQGIELYDLMCNTLKLDEYVKDLDKEIEELHDYVHLLGDNRRSRNGEMLSAVAAFFLPATLVTGIFGMNYTEDGNVVPCFYAQLGIALSLSMLGILIWYKLKHKNK